MGVESRYSRQIRFSGVGEAGQRRIRASSVAVVGCGALGSVQAEMMTRAGVGRLRLIDRDFVEWSNLQRQFLFEESDAADSLPKAAAAAKRLARVNSEVALEPMVADLTASNAADLFEGIDLILDGVDNFETRYLINDAAVSGGVPWIYGAAVGSYGLKVAILPGRTACLRCIYPDPPASPQPTCETEGVLAPVTATIAALQVADALKILAMGFNGPAERGRKDVENGSNMGADRTNAPGTIDALITRIDVWSGEIRQTSAPSRDPECPCCARREFAYLDGSRRAPISLCGRNAVQIHERSRPVDLNGLARRLEQVAPVRANEFALRADLAPYELMVFPDGRAIIRGTTDIGIARSLYARYVGA
jgi:molybdopterin/thiamine biosynthesis adenylyltransferase